MLMHKTEMEACREWVDTFNNIPGGLLERAYGPEGDALKLLAGGLRKSDCCGVESEERSKTKAELEDDERHQTRSENCVHKCSECDKPCGWSWGGAVYAWPAGWGTLFNPKNSSDEDWMNQNAEEIADKCGLIVYECDEVGILLGVDGGGYDFYEQHWLPLYRLRGLEWHDIRAKAEAKTKACQHRSRFAERVCEAEAEERADRKAELVKQKPKLKAEAKTKAKAKAKAKTKTKAGSKTVKARRK